MCKDKCGQALPDNMMCMFTKWVSEYKQFSSSSV